MTSARHGFYLAISCLGLALGLWGIHSQWSSRRTPARDSPRRVSDTPSRSAVSVLGSPEQLRFEIQARPIGSTVEVESAPGLDDGPPPAADDSRSNSRPPSIAGLFFFAVNLFVFLGRIDRSPARDFYWATLFFGLAVMIGDASPPARRAPRSIRDCRSCGW